MKIRKFFENLPRPIASNFKAKKIFSSNKYLTKLCFDQRRSKNRTNSARIYWTKNVFFAESRWISIAPFSESQNNERRKETFSDDVLRIYFSECRRKTFRRSIFFCLQMKKLFRQKVELNVENARKLVELRVVWSRWFYFSFSIEKFDKWSWKKFFRFV